MSTIAWLDEVMTGHPPAGTLARSDGQHFSPTDIAELRNALAAHPWRELVMTVHETSNAAKVAKSRQAKSPRWSHTPGITLHTRKVGEGGLTAVVVKWTPTDRPTR